METSDSFGTLNIGSNERHELTRENTSVFRHLGAAAIFDHVFVSLSDNAGVYIWRDNPGHDRVAAAAVEAECVTHLNLPEAAEVDVTAYIRHHTDDADSTPDWLPDLA